MGGSRITRHSPAVVAALLGIAPAASWAQTDEIQVYTGEINKPGEFNFACLIAGHMEAGMIGKITVAAKKHKTAG